MERSTDYQETMQRVCATLRVHVDDLLAVNRSCFIPGSFVNVCVGSDGRWGGAKCVAQAASVKQGIDSVGDVWVAFSAHPDYERQGLLVWIDDLEKMAAPPRQFEWQQTPDLSMPLTIDWTTGAATIDLALTPSGDLALVTGITKLVQAVSRFLMTPKGSLVSQPGYGNSLLYQVGMSGGDRDVVARQMLAEAEAWFHVQADLHPQGALDRLTLIDTSVGPSQNDPKYLKVTFRVTSRAGEFEEVSLPFQLKGHQVSVTAEPQYDR